MKKFITYLIAMMMSWNLYAQEVSITSSISIYPQKFDGKCYIVLAFGLKEERRLMPTTCMKIKLFNGEILKFDGYVGTSKSSSASFGSMGPYVSTSFTSTSTYEYIRYEITEDEINKLNEGVKKVSINSVPKIFIKEFKTDQIGKTLYEEFEKINDDF